MKEGKKIVTERDERGQKAKEIIDVQNKIKKRIETKQPKEQN
jgi:hypothetical protein